MTNKVEITMGISNRSKFGRAPNGEPLFTMRQFWRPYGGPNSTIGTLNDAKTCLVTTEWGPRLYLPPEVGGFWGPEWGPHRCSGVMVKSGSPLGACLNLLQIVWFWSVWPWKLGNCQNNEGITCNQPHTHIVWFVPNLAPAANHEKFLA